MNIIKNKKGSIAIMSILIISAMLTIVVIGMSDISLNSLYRYSNHFSSQTTNYLSQACLDEGISRLEENLSFPGTQLIFDDDTSCTITVSGNNPYILDISTTYLDSTENYRADISMITVGQANNSTLTNWKEI